VSAHLGDRALVLGGSMAGLFAGHALSGYFREVLIVDRDQLVGVTGLRRTTPQSFHAHALLARGQRAVEELFPGITKEFAAAGVPVGDVGADLRWVVNGERLRPNRGGLVCLATPRITLENRVREKVRSHPNVTFLEYTDVLGLVATPDHSRIIGARVRRRGGPDGGPAGEPVSVPGTGAGAGSGPGSGSEHKPGHASGRHADQRSAEEVISADLVVDTTGRGSQLPDWLEGLGYPRPEEQRMRIGLGYSTRHYRLPLGLLGTDLAYIVVQTPQTPRGAVFAREHALPDGGERYTLSLNAYLDQRPPADADGFLAYTRTLSVPHIYDWIRTAEPLDQVRTYQFPSTQWRHYERLGSFPAGLLAMGDSLASPNPVYAQGNTISAVEALILRGHLARGAVPDARQCFTDFSQLITSAWDINIAGDIGHPGIEGPRSIKTRMASNYLPMVQRAALYDETVAGSFLRVAGLIDPPTALMKPGPLLRVLRTLRRNAGRPAPTGAGTVTGAVTGTGSGGPGDNGSVDDKAGVGTRGPGVRAVEETVAAPAEAGE
jgi:2-polyprenyl-6-methoxyphenol hydroxylase-like FAD-dependent oxidoreductase